MENSILKQKSQLYQFKEGDANKKYFHALLRGRKRKLFIYQVKNEEGQWIQGDSEIAEAACKHFQHIFTGENKKINEEALNYVPRMVAQNQNDLLVKMPELDEVKHIVF